MLGAELAYCVPLGIPHSIFLGRVPPGPGEPLWTHDDRAKALAWQADQAAHCGQCGQRQSDWRDDEGVQLRTPPFELVESVCPSCEWLEMDAADRQESKGQRTQPGLKLGFKRVPEAT